MPTQLGQEEGNNQWAALARHGGIPRGLRPQACTEATCARTGRSCVLPGYAGNASRSLRTYGDDERTQEVGQCVVPTKSVNKLILWFSAEWMEGRRLVKGNAGACSRFRAQYRI